MILTRTPLRVSFCGGGSDIPSFYEKHGGCVVSTTIDKYVYLAVHKSFYPNEYILKYSSMERVSDINAIKHPIFRECLRDYETGYVEITSMADVPAGTGLGSSSSFTVGLINTLRAYNGLSSDKEFLASAACDMEMVRLGEPIGKQDQYAAAYGGLNYYRFNRDGTVDAEPIHLTAEETSELESSLMMFYTGITRKASNILAEQSSNISRGSAEENQLRICEIAEKLRADLENGDLESLGRRLDESWKIKKTLASGITSEAIDAAYETAMEHGACGGKLLGAGGGGFLLMYVPRENQAEVAASLGEYKQMPIALDTLGSTLIYSEGTFQRP